MSRNFELLKELESESQPTLDANRDSRAASGYATILTDQLAQIERIVGQSIGKLKAVVDECADAAKSEKEAAEQVVAALKAESATLAGKLRDAEGWLKRRDEEVTDLIANLHLLTDQAAQHSQSLQQVKSDAASAALRARADFENANGKIAELEAKIGETESTLRVKDSAMTEVEQSSRSRIAQLEVQLRDKDLLLAESDRQIDALKSEVSRLKDGMLEMASLVTMRTKIITDGNPTKRAPAAGETVNPAPAQPSYSQVPELPTSALFDR